VIEFRKVFKAFGPKKVLNGLNLQIAKGDIFFILGRSGTGKSVALKHLVGLLKADSGEIFLDGTPLHSLSEKDFGPIRQKCGLVFQLPALLDSRTLFENLSFGIRSLDLKTQIQKVKDILPEVNLEHLLKDLSTKYPPQLSYGEQKRMALARTLVVDPDYVLYDEPTTGLDPITSRNVHKLISKVSKGLGKTSVVVSHDMRNALATADKIAVLDAGQVIDYGTPDEILKSKVKLTKDFLADLRPKEET
jgi:phospholipid/cholesterol/gamma-HCH transport system ATP-binding protein